MTRRFKDQGFTEQELLNVVAQFRRELHQRLWEHFY
jgi:hypothetical protein